MMPICTKQALISSQGRALANQGGHSHKDMPLESKGILMWMGRVVFVALNDQPMR
jgi:hypothetical protein